MINEKLLKHHYHCKNCGKRARSEYDDDSIICWCGEVMTLGFDKFGIMFKGSGFAKNDIDHYSSMR